jgi:integrase/recombinase XerD
MSAGAFEQHRAAFLEMLRVRNYSPKSIQSYRLALEGFLRFAASQGLTQVQDVTAETVRAYHHHLQGRGLAVTSRFAYLKTARLFFGHLEKTDVVLINPCAGVPLPKLERRLPHCLTREDARKLIDTPDTSTPKGIRDRAILELFYSTGIRLAEMAALKLHDVDCRSGLMHVVQGKGRKDRIVPVGRKAIESLQRYLVEVRRKWISGRGEQEALWLSAIEPHGPITSQIMQVTVRKYGQRAGIRVTPHLWRHTCATHLVSNGANIAYVQRLLGHTSLDSTQIYTRVAVPDLQATHARKHPRAKTKPPRHGL